MSHPTHLSGLPGTCRRRRHLLALWICSSLMRISLCRARHQSWATVVFRFFDGKKNITHTYLKPRQQPHIRSRGCGFFYPLCGNAEFTPAFNLFNSKRQSLQCNRIKIHFPESMSCADFIYLFCGQYFNWAESGNHSFSGGPI